MNKISALGVMIICAVIICFMNTLQLNGLHKAYKKVR